jgi:glycosyltransferase involved in cell wall biosynthesis
MTQPTRSPLVSVVIAAYNEQAYIAEALHSVLAQTHHPIELIVVDDGSIDGTAEITAQIATHNGGRSLELVQVAHHGQSAARNAGLKRFSGQYWTIFDADDVMPPDRLTHQVAHLQQHPEHDIVLGLTEAFITPGQPKPPHYNPLWDDGPFPGHAGTMMARRAVLDTVGGYDESMALGEDLDWQARAKAAGIRAGALDHVCLHYRIHRANTSSDTRANRAATLQLLRASVQRRRGHETARD